MKHIKISVSTTPTTTNVENNFQFIILLSTKLWYTLAPNSLDKLMQLISMEPLIYDLARSKITDLDKFLKKTRSLVPSWCNLTTRIYTF